MPALISIIAGIVLVFCIFKSEGSFEQPISQNFYVEGVVVPDSVPPKMRFKVRRIYEKDSPTYGTFDTREEAVAWVKQADVLLMKGVR